MTQKLLKTSNYYTTSDLAQATAISLFFPIEAIDKQQPSKAQFLFKREQGLDELIEAYWKRQLKVEAQAYFNQLKAIKTRLYETR